MKQRRTILFLCSILTTLSLNANDTYSMEHIYNNMCIECHSADGSGNTEKLTPSMIGQNEKEIKNALIEIEKDQGHVIMEHNRGEIIKMGMQYPAKNMAEYLYKRFSKK